MSQLARRKCGARVRVRARAVGEIWRVHTFRETAPLRAPDGGALPNESACVCGGGGITQLPSLPGHLISHNHKSFTRFILAAALNPLEGNLLSTKTQGHFVPYLNWRCKTGFSPNSLSV